MRAPSALRRRRLQNATTACSPLLICIRNPYKTNVFNNRRGFHGRGVIYRQADVHAACGLIVHAKYGGGIAIARLNGGNENGGVGKII